jgi:hypothetical protein
MFLVVRRYRKNKSKLAEPEGVGGWHWNNQQPGPLGIKHRWWVLLLIILNIIGVILVKPAAAHQVARKM